MKLKRLIAAALTGGIILTSISTFAMPTDRFDAGMEKGISYFNQGLYYEAWDEFQWFRDYNQYELNEGQKQYLSDWLDGTYREIQEYEHGLWLLAEAMRQFNEGIEKGNSYFDKGFYYEAKDEFQWLAGYDYDLLSEDQRQYLSERLDAAKQALNKNYTGTYASYDNLNDIYVDYFDGDTISFSICSVNGNATRIACTDTITASVKNAKCFFNFEDSRGGYGTGTLKIYKGKLVLDLNYTEYGLDLALSSGTYLKK